MSQFYDQASLVMIPSGYKTGKVYSQKPLSADGELTFTRASNATRVNADGLIEKVRTNIILQSNQFDTTWARTGTNVPTSNAIANPLSGAVDAFKLVESAVTSFHFIVQYPVFSTGEVSFSFYAKAAERTTCSILLTQSGSNGGFFDLSTGVATASGAGNTASMVALSNGWYRCNVTNNGSATVVNQVRIGIADGALGSYAGDGTSGIYIYAAQAEQGVPTDYIPTTTAAVSVGPVSGLPRLDYSGGCPSLLLEPQTTALNQSSEQLDSVYWTQTGTTTTANQIVSPDGYQNADLVAATNAVGNRVEQTGFSLSGSHTFSIFLKKGTSTRNLWYDGGKGVQIDWAVDGTPTVTAFSGGPAPASFGSVDYGNGWHRVWFQDTYSGTYVMRLFPDRIGTTGTVYAWGANLTPTSYLQSYIPTLGSAVTRLADACSKTGVSSLIGQTEGILFVDFVYDTKSGSNRFSLSDGTTNNWIFIGTPEGGSTNVSRFYIRTNNVVWVDVGASSYFTFGERYKLALAYKSGDWAVYGNGTLLYSGTSTIQAVSSPLSVFNFFSVSGASAASAEKINQALIFKTRLTNAQLAALTTL